MDGVISSFAEMDTGVVMGKCVDEEVGVCTELSSVSVEASVSSSSSDPSGVGGKDAAVILKNSLSSGS